MFCCVLVFIVIYSGKLSSWIQLAVHSPDYHTHSFTPFPTMHQCSISSSMLCRVKPLQFVALLCRKALRGAASSLGESQPFMQPKHNFSDPSSLHKDCDFTLDLRAVVAAKAGSGSQGLPLPSPGLPLDSQEVPSDSTEISKLDSVGSRWLGRFWRPSSHEKHVQPQDLILNGTLLSGNCGMQLQINATTTHIEVYEAKAVNYTFMVTALTFVQVHQRFHLFKPRSCLCRVDASMVSLNYIMCALHWPCPLTREARVLLHCLHCSGPYTPSP